ncbi:MAG: glycerate kinase, partial [Armatimonadota bacterium]
MKIVICPDSFKGSLTSVEAADAIKQGVISALADAEIVKIPLADGGEGTLEALVQATGGQLRKIEVYDPLMRPVKACFGLLDGGKTAVIEMASASGLPLLSEDECNPLITSTYGTGQLMLAAVELGVEKIILGIGGSATNDGGTGAMSALGAVFLDENGNALPPGGAALA